MLYSGKLFKYEQIEAHLEDEIARKFLYSPYSWSGLIASNCCLP
jgi:hypothetical protein